MNAISNSKLTGPFRHGAISHAGGAAPKPNPTKRPIHHPGPLSLPGQQGRARLDEQLGSAPGFAETKRTKKGERKIV